MKPLRSILDPSFHYVPAVATSVASTWKRAGWCPTRDKRFRGFNMDAPGLPAADEQRTLGAHDDDCCCKVRS